jgi:hypothetical protein
LSLASADPPETARSGCPIVISATPVARNVSI